MSCKCFSKPRRLYSALTFKAVGTAVGRNGWAAELQLRSVPFVVNPVAVRPSMPDPSKHQQFIKEMKKTSRNLHLAIVIVECICEASSLHRPRSMPPRTLQLTMLDHQPICAGRGHECRCTHSTITASHLASFKHATRHSASGISPCRGGGAYPAEQLKRYPCGSHRGNCNPSSTE